MKRRHFDLFVLFLWTLINVPTCLSTNNSSVLDEFSELVSAQISVSIDPLNVVYENQTAQGVYCTLSIHRDNCLNPKIRATETISWHTRICFKWTCSNTTTHVMKIESCWTGSSRKPIFLIDKNGTPRYENHLLAAYSVGYLSVRLVGADKIRLSCTVRLCHVCQQQCPLITPPRKCPDSKSISNYLFTRWNNTDELEQQCRPDEYNRKRHAKNVADNQRTSTSFLLSSLFILSQVRKLY